MGSPHRRGGAIVSYPAIGSNVERFRAAIIAQIGLQFDDAKLGFLQEVLQRRLDKLGRSGDAYLAGLEQTPSPREITTLAQDLTVGETYFFRNKEQFRALAEAVLPQRLRRQPRRKLRLLSAGCASGEEAYSMAIVARETLDPACEVMIRAVDINLAALEKARRARYSSWALRETSPDIQRRWFREAGRELVLAEELTAAVAFDNANLASDDPELWRAGTYDAIFCRNVLMYFAPEQMRAVIARIAQSLAPGGFLFLGHAETLRGVSDAFHLRHTHDTFYYELKERGELTQPVPQQWITPAAAPAAGLAWFEAIREASERVAALLSAPPADAPAPAQPSPRAFDLAPALDHLRNERFSEALDHVHAGPQTAEKDPNVLLLKATLFAHSGQLAAAEDACHRLLLIDELNAGAHYVLALCREHAGERDRASEHDRFATYLDPAFAMPRLHLGLIAKRGGDRATARRQLTQALELLKREDASRLLLFGGGFSREALMAVCQSALRECGGRA
jgi:chemotaxis protein methyltransferase CheR